MNVKAILAAKSRSLGGDTITIEPTATLAAASTLLAARKIGAIVILGAGGRLAGILSERDIVRALAEQGADALALPVGQVMTRNVMTCGEDDKRNKERARALLGRTRPPALSSVRGITPREVAT